jgi:type I restriction enzyme, S subunit
MLTPISEITVSLRNGKSVRQSADAGGLPITRIETIADGTIDPERVGFADLQMDDCTNWLMQEADILISHINSTKHLGKCAIYQGNPVALVHGMNLLALRVDRGAADAQFVYRMLSSPEFRRQLPQITKDSVNQSSFNISNFRKLLIPLPPLPEQKRIAGILDAADALRTRRRESLAQFDILLQSTFLSLFGDPVTNPMGWTDASLLGDLAEIVSGVTKGRKIRDRKIRDVPYLAVANVQDGHLELGTVKSIPATDGEIAKFRLAVHVNSFETLPAVIY